METLSYVVERPLLVGLAGFAVGHFAPRPAVGVLGAIGVGLGTRKYYFDGMTRILADDVRGAGNTSAARFQAAIYIAPDIGSKAASEAFWNVAAFALGFAVGVATTSKR